MSAQTLCEYCTGPITYEKRAEGHLGGCPHCGMMGIRIVSPAEAESFVSSEQFLRIARTATAYGDLRRFLRVMAWLNAVFILGVMVFLIAAHVQTGLLSFEWLILCLLASVFIMICDFFGYQFTVMWVDLVDTQITANRLKLYRKNK